MKRKHSPKQQSLPGELWLLDVNDEGKFTVFAVCVGELNPRSGNYPLLVLDCCGPATLQPGQRMNAAVTAAKWWRKVVL